MTRIASALNSCIRIQWLLMSIVWFEHSPLAASFECASSGDSGETVHLRRICVGAGSNIVWYPALRLCL